MSRFRTDSAIGVELHHPVAFWIGVVLLIGGVLAHLPEFFSMESMGYGMAGMEMSTGMLLGMVAIVAGLALSTWGLVPRLAALTRRGDAAASLHVHAMDGARLSWVHFWLLFVLCIALIVDVMKPATLGFVMPGMKSEYGLTTAELSTFPLSALTGTTLGSFLWGLMADRIGRRATILLAALFFVATSICGFMPSFGWNLFMCFIMGLSAGGMLPIVYALMAETVPVRMRGWLIILHGGIGTMCGYLVASGLAAVFEPVYTWRILWFFGLPTGLAIVALNRYIPESPRFLLSRGDEAAARAVMSRFGIVAEQPHSKPDAVHVMMAQAATRMSAARRLRALFKPPLLRHSLTILLYGVGWGLVNWGFLTFLPMLLRDAGFAANATSVLLFQASLAALPAIALVSFLYGTWSSRRTMAGCAAITCLVMAGFAYLSPDVARLERVEILLVVMVLMAASTAVISMLSPYAAEVYPTMMRGTGSGFAAGTGKFGGMVGPPLMGLMLSAAGTPLVPILVMGIPIGLAALLLVFTGVETRGRGLEQISGHMGESRE
jgi:putative MFS transporter